MLRVQKLTPDAKTPMRTSPDAAGYDLVSVEDICVPARGRCLVKTGIAVAIPRNTYARIAPRSGLALKNGLDVGAGVVDYDYRGEIGVILFNHTDDPYKVCKGDRIAQMILESIVTPDVFEVDSLDTTERGSGGFGSTNTISYFA